MKYSHVVTYVKRTNLLEYLKHHNEYDYHCDKLREHYAKERPVRLVLSVRKDGNRTFCSIKCPINPLPVKGEFEVPNMAVIGRFLEREGWSKVDTISARLFE